MGLVGAEAAAAGGITVEGWMGSGGRFDLRTWDLIDGNPEIQMRSDGTGTWISNPRVDHQQGRSFDEPRWLDASNARAARMVLAASRVDLVLPLLYFGRMLSCGSPPRLASEFSTVGAPAWGLRLTRDEWSAITDADATHSLPGSWPPGHGVASAWVEEAGSGELSVVVFPCGDSRGGPDQDHSSRGWMRPSEEEGTFEPPGQISPVLFPDPSDRFLGRPPLDDR